MKWFGGKDFSNENVSDRSPKPVSERQTEKIIAQTEKKNSSGIENSYGTESSQIQT